MCYLKQSKASAVMAAQHYQDLIVLLAIQQMMEMIAK